MTDWKEVLRREGAKFWKALWKDRSQAKKQITSVKSRKDRRRVDAE